jgi:hypothetical protein
MLRLAVIGLLGSAASLAGVMASKLMQDSHATPETASQTLQQVKTDLTGVPVIAGGEVEGYLVFQLNSTIDASKLPKPDFVVQPYLADAAIRASFQVAKDGTQNFNATFLQDLSEQLRAQVNQKLAADIVVAVNVEAFNYVPKNDIRGRMLKGGKSDDGH